MNTQSKQKRKRITNIGELILASVAVVGITTTLALFPGIALALAPFIKKKKYSPKQVVERTVDSLVRNGLLKKTKDSKGNEQIILTQKGKVEAFFRSKSHEKTNGEWDGIWRVIIFDIPQSKRKIRTELRKAMRLYGFKLLQQSVWVYPYPCEDFIGVIKSHLGVSRDVLYMKVNYIENDIHLRKEFSIKNR